MTQNQEYINPLECAICKLNCIYREISSELIKSNLKINVKDCSLFKYRLQEIKNKKIKRLKEY